MGIFGDHPLRGSVKTAPISNFIRTFCRKFKTHDLQLIDATVASTTVAQFEERLLAVLHHTPPGAKVQPTIDNTTPPRPLDDPLDDNNDSDDAFYGMSQATVPHSDRILRAMDRHILNGDMLKARRSTKGGGVADIGDTTVLNNLRLKYPRGAPTQPPPDSGATRTNLVDHLTVCIEDSTSLAAHIMSKKRGASMTLTEHSNDQYQDILRQSPFNCRLFYSGMVSLRESIGRQLPLRSIYLDYH